MAKRPVIVFGSLAAILVALLVVFGYLRRDPTAGVERATVGNAQSTPATAPAAPAPAGTPLPLSAENVELMFTGSSALGAQPGFFSDLSGVATVSNVGELLALDGEVIMSSVLTNADSLTAKLKSEPGMFEVDKHPTATFASTRIEPLSGAPKATHTVAGDLTVRGVTRPISFPATITRDGAGLTLSSAFSVNRHDFGITYDGGSAFPDIRPDVLINLDIRVPMPARGGAPPSTTRPG